MRSENGVLGKREMRVAVGRIRRIGPMGPMGRFSVSGRECERRCEDWLGEGERGREVRSEK